MTEIKESYSERKEGENDILSEPSRIEMDPKYTLADIKKMYVVCEEYYKSARYLDILEFIPFAVKSTEDAAKKVMQSALSIALLSSQKVIDSLKSANLKDMELGIQRAESLIRKTKSEYFYENYQSSVRSLNELSILTSRLQINQRENIFKSFGDLESDIQKVKGFGTNTKKAKMKLNDAWKYFEQDQLVQASNSVRSAREEIENAKEDRISVISETVSFVEKLIEAAREIGAGVDLPSKEMERAKNFFSQGQYQMCMFITIKAEEITTDIIHSQAQKVRNLQRTLVTRYQEVSTTESEVDDPRPGVPKNFRSEIERIITSVPKIKHCPDCENQIEYYDRYRRWYCPFCKKYL